LSYLIQAAVLPRQPSVSLVRTYHQTDQPHRQTDLLPFLH